MSDSLFKVGLVQRERELPWDLELGPHTPQAILRDLHRPAKDFAVSLLDFEQLPGWDRAGASATSDLKTILYADYRSRIWEVTGASRAMVDETSALRALLVRPWQDAPKIMSKLKPLPASMGWIV